MTKTPGELLFENMKMENDKLRELDGMKERMRALHAEQKQLSEKMDVLEHQIGIHRSDALKYMRELLAKV